MLHREAAHRHSKSLYSYFLEESHPHQSLLLCGMGNLEFQAPNMESFDRQVVQQLHDLAQA